MTGNVPNIEQIVAEVVRRLKLLADGVQDRRRTAVTVAAIGLGLSATATWYLRVVFDRVQRRFRDRVEPLGTHRHEQRKRGCDRRQARHLRVVCRQVADALGVRAVAMGRECVDPAVAARTARDRAAPRAGAHRLGERRPVGEKARLGAGELQRDGKVHW